MIGRLANDAATGDVDDAVQTLKCFMCCSPSNTVLKNKQWIAALLPCNLDATQPAETTSCLDDQ